MQVLTWIHDTAIGEWVRASEWGYPIVLTAHAIGMAAVVGPVLAFDLRVLGFARRMPLAWFDAIYPIAWLGFGVNALSGAALFTGDPAKFVASRPFQVKIALILAGMVAIFLLGRSLETQTAAADARPSGRARLIAALSIIFWLGAITAGRLIAYIDADG
jgi:hypothetical protein